MSSPTPSRQGLRKRYLQPVIGKVFKIFRVSQNPSSEPATQSQQVPAPDPANEVRQRNKLARIPRDPQDTVDGNLPLETSRTINRNARNTAVGTVSEASREPSFIDITSHPATVAGNSSLVAGESLSNDDVRGSSRDSGDRPSSDAVRSQESILTTAIDTNAQIAPLIPLTRAQVQRLSGPALGSNTLQSTEGEDAEFVPTIITTPATLQGAAFDRPALQTAARRKSNVRPIPSQESVSPSATNRGTAVRATREISTNTAGGETVNSWPSSREGLPTLAAATRFVFHHEVLCHLRITLDTDVLQSPKPFPVRWYNEDAYEKVARVAEDCIRTAKNLVLSNLKIRDICALQYGSFIIRSRNSQTSKAEKLDYEDQAAEQLAIAIMTFMVQRRFETPALCIDWKFATVGVSPIFREPYERTVRRAIDRYKTMGENVPYDPQPRPYFPAEDLFQVLHGETMKLIIKNDESLSSDKTEFETLIRKRVATKLFALCVYTGLPMAFLNELLHCEENFNNKNPPVPTLFWKDYPTRLQKWKWEFETLLERQPSFFAHRFAKVTDDTTGFPIADHVIMPIKFYERRGFGTYSEVFRVRIHPQHHVFEDDKTIFFALKRLKPIQKKEVRKEKYQQELAILSILQKQRDQQPPHINVHYTAWNQGENFCILFPLADMNLDEYMNDPEKRAAVNVPCRDGTNMPKLTGMFVDWLFKQLHGLAAALASFHHIVYKDENLTAADPRDFNATAYHHDIKPQNILVFLDGNSAYGTLKFTDFGSAHVKTGPILDRQSHYEMTPESSKRASLGALARAQAAVRTPFESNVTEGAAGYEAPDLWLHGAHSRKADVWSLGCVYLQVLDWCFNTRLEDGPSFMTELLGVDSQGSRISTDCFWRRIELPGNVKKAELKPAVEEKFKELENTHCSGKQALISLVGSVRRMLAIHTQPEHEPKKHKIRLTSAELTDSLNAAYEEVKDKIRTKDDFYCDPEPAVHSNIARRPPPPSTAPTEGGGTPDREPFEENTDGTKLSPQTSPNHQRTLSATRRELAQDTPTLERTQFPSAAIPASIPQGAAMGATEHSVRQPNPFIVGAAADSDGGHPATLFEKSS